MNEETNNIINADEDMMLPEGWDGKSDFFAEPEAQPEGSASEQAAPDLTMTPEAAAVPPTTEGQAAEKVPQEQVPTTAPAPGTDAAPGAPAPSRIRFTAKVDHDLRDVEIGEEELPGIYQRSQVAGRFQQRLQELQPRLDRAERLARELGYGDLEEMVEKAGARYRESQVEQMVQDGTPRAMAEFIAEQKAKAAVGNIPTTNGTGGQGEDGGIPTTNAPESAVQRDFAREVAELKQAFPEAGADGHLPEAVVSAAVREGKPLIAVYAAWVAGQKTAEAQALQQQNAILKQNEANKAKAPVTGATGGGDTGQKPVDAFLAGFND